MRTEQIIEFQEAIKKCPQVWGVYIRCAGERDLQSLWATKEAADMARDAHNGMKGNGAGYYGRATVASFRIQSEAMALELFGTALRRNVATNKGE